MLFYRVANHSRGRFKVEFSLNSAYDFIWLVHDLEINKKMRRTLYSLRRCGLNVLPFRVV
jgi:hypothetical protein